MHQAAASAQRHFRAWGGPLWGRRGQWEAERGRSRRPRVERSHALRGYGGRRAVHPQAFRRLPDPPSRDRRSNLLASGDAVGDRRVLYNFISGRVRLWAVKHQVVALTVQTNCISRNLY